MPGVVSLPEGIWVNLDEDGVDRARLGEHVHLDPGNGARRGQHHARHERRGGALYCFLWRWLKLEPFGAAWLSGLEPRENPFDMPGKV